MKIHRREFLTRSALGVGSALLGAPLLADAKPSVKNFDPYASVKIGQSKLKFSRIVLGTGVKGGKRESNLTRMGQAKAEALIREAHDRGVDTFDLADLYGTHPY